MEFRIRPVLTEGDIRFIYEEAIRVLHEVGVQCDHKGILERLSQSCRMEYRNGRILLHTEDLEEYFEGLKKELADTVRQDEPFSMGGSWNCLELCDPLTNSPRPATMEEAIRMAKLSEALGSPGTPIPVSPGETNPRLRTLVSEKIALLHTRGMGNWLTATDREEITILKEMHKAAGRKYKLGLEGLITPLRINSEVYDTYFDWCDDPDIEIGIMGGIPVAGSTSPLVFPASLILPLAEGIALDFIGRKISDDRIKFFDVRMEIFDMKYANLAYGSPEHCLAMQALRELKEGLFGIKGRGGTFRSNGKIVDGQTLIERTGSFLWQATLGSRKFSAVGQLCVDEVYSPVQAVLDREILRYGQRVLQGIGEDCWDRQTDMVELIREGVKDNGFLMHDSTLDVFRSFYSFDRLSAANSLGAWRNGGSRSLEALAWEEAQRMIDAHTFELEDDARREIEKLVEKGEKLLCS